MAFIYENPNPCLNNCECKVTTPAKPCPHDDGCLSLCSISAIPNDPNDTTLSIDILSGDFPHNLSACDGSSVVLSVEDYDSDFFESVSLSGSVLEWVPSKPGYSEVTIKGTCGNYSSYMCVLVKSTQELGPKSSLVIKNEMVKSTSNIQLK